MENNEKLIIDNIYNDRLQKVFRLDYEDQNIRDNKVFQKWKYEIIKENDKPIRLYKCNKDKIYFGERIDNSLDTYVAKCPECNKYVCCFCGNCIKTVAQFEPLEDYCCLKRLFFFMFYSEKEVENEEEDFPIWIYILFYIGYIIPIINNFFLILFVIQNLFCYRKSKKHNEKYERIFQNHGFIYNIMTIIISGFIISMTIPYAILSFIYIIIIFFISILFKMIPLKNFMFFIIDNSVKDI